MEQMIIKSNSPALSEDIRALSQAFLVAKQNFLATGFGGTNAHQRYNYAKIEDIYRAVEGALSVNNIIIWHFARPEGGVEYLHTRLIHTLTGQFIEDCRVLESEKAGNQAKGAANTYMRKYALLSLCAIATQDDDGEDEERYIAKKFTETHKVNEPCISSDQLKAIQKTLKECPNGKALYPRILYHHEIKDLTQLRASKFDEVNMYIQRNWE